MSKGFFSVAQTWNYSKERRHNLPTKLRQRKDSNESGPISHLGPKIFKYLNGLNDMPAITRPGISISSLYYMCPKQIVLSLLYPKQVAKEKITGINRMKMGFGTWIHSLLQDDYLGNSRLLYGIWECNRCQNTIIGYKPKELCECSSKCLDKCIWPKDQVPELDCGYCGRFGGWSYKEPYIQDKTYGLKGKCDGIVIYQDKPAVLEIKTVNKRSFDSLVEPKKDHVMQLMLYMHYLNIDRGILLYFKREEPSRPKEFLVIKDEELLHKTLNIVKNLYRCIKDGIIPDPICEAITDARAKRCPWKDECFTQDNQLYINNLKLSDSWPTQKVKETYPAAINEFLESIPASDTSVIQLLKLDRLDQGSSKLVV